ncbi:MAG: DUF1697 domain-containing protein [Candidatus Hydrothermarchaeales archaeon]
MEIGIAFIRGINFYSIRRIRKEEIFEILKDAESKNLKILGGYKSDNVIFAKEGIHYAAVGKIFEDLLEKHFGSKVFVTTRSLRSVKGILNKVKESEG